MRLTSDSWRRRWQQQMWCGGCQAEPGTGRQGAQRLAGFRRMREAIACDDWQLAATEALDRRWAAQTGRRAQHIAGMLRGGGTSA